MRFEGTIYFERIKMGENITIQDVDIFIMNHFKKSKAFPETLLMDIEDYIEFSYLFPLTEFSRQPLLFRGIKIEPRKYYG